MLILAFDTATPAVTVALCDGSGVLEQESAQDARRHGELLAPFIGQVLARTGAGVGDLTAVAVGTGPGPYTGLRVGLVTAEVLGSTLGIPVHGICSLDVIAAAFIAAARTGAAVTGAALTGGREFIVATDARRREVYWARYGPSGKRLSGPDVSLPALLPVGLPVAGEGPELYPELAAEPVGPRFPDAAVLAGLVATRIKDGVAPGLVRPLYLRRPDAKVPGPPKRVTP